ncbi:MAG: B12-binding domain-containing radical SAM protein, partial [bacterium]
LDHLENLVKNYGVRHFHFEDDNLTLDKARFMELMNGVIDRGLKFTWDTPNGVFANAIDEEMMEIMKVTGCTYLIIGVESGDQYVLDNVINKQPLTIEHVRRVFKLGKKVGVDLQAFYIIGFPRETIDQIKTTTDFAMESLKKYNVLPHMAIARPDPGTDLFKEAQSSGNLVVDRARDTEAGVHTDTFVRYMVKSDTFTPEKVAEISEQFHRDSIRTITLKSMGYMLLHPIVAAKCTRYLIASLLRTRGRVPDSIVKLFFCKLFYQNALLRENAIAPEYSGKPEDYGKLIAEPEAS